MTIFAWVMLVFSSIAFLSNLPTICNSKYLKGLYLLIACAANTFYFVAYLFLSLDPSIFNVYTWAVLIFSAVTCLFAMIFCDTPFLRFIALVGHAPQIVFYVLILLA